MRRAWRWRLCAASWIAGAYICFLIFIAIVNITDPALQRSRSEVPTEIVQVMYRKLRRKR